MSSPVPSTITRVVTEKLFLAGDLGLIFLLKPFCCLCHIPNPILGAQHSREGRGASLWGVGGGLEITCESSVSIFWMRRAYCPSFCIKSL